MKKIILLVFCLYLGGVIMSFALDKVEQNAFMVMSNDFKNNEFLNLEQALSAPDSEGKNLSPELSWSNPPENTKSFAIVCHDPDAPVQNGWYHWFVIDINKNIHEITKDGKIPNSKELITSFGKIGYGGPRPPKGHGVHHYNFTIYALDSEKLQLKENLSPKEIEEQIQAHSIAKSSITGLYERN